MPSPHDLPGLPDRFEPGAELLATRFERSLSAYDTLLQRDVVLKFPGEEVWSDWSVTVRDRLLREARALAKVRHPGIAVIHEVVDAAVGPVLVLEPPEGELLADQLLSGPLDVEVVCRIGVELAEALAALHYASVVHRAIGPEAVRLRPDGSVRLGSFTFAKEFAARGGASSINYKSADLQWEESALPPYPAPEQITGNAADARCDIYALGCLLFRCLLGSDPFTAGYRPREAKVPDLRRLRPEVKPALAAIVRRCLAYEPGARYQTAQAVADALRAARSDVGRRPALAGRLLIAGAAVGIGLAGWFAASGGATGERERGGGGEPGGAVVAAPASTTALLPHYERCHALLIGIADAYGETPLARLNNPVHDIEAVKARLSGCTGWQSITVLEEREATKANILRALDELKHCGRDDGVFVYLAGHGVTIDRSDSYWFAAADAKTLTPEVSDAGFIPSQRLLDLCLEDHCQAKHVFLVVDTCYAGMLIPRLRGNPLRPAASSVRDDSSVLIRRRAKQLLVAVDRKLGAADGRGSLSPFCSAFVAALRGVPGDRLVTASKIGASIRDTMAASATAWSEQMPEIVDLAREGGDFTFFLRRE
ncbi:MAG: caspase family protein [Planctomycetes bacterium]|nr:caspase family protein [Planctomycetota bacterium]